MWKKFCEAQTLEAGREISLRDAFMTGCNCRAITKCNAFIHSCICDKIHHGVYTKIHCLASHHECLCNRGIRQANGKCLANIHECICLYSRNKICRSFNHCNCYNHRFDHSESCVHDKSPDKAFVIFVERKIIKKLFNYINIIRILITKLPNNVIIEILNYIPIKGFNRQLSIYDINELIRFARKRPINADETAELLYKYIDKITPLKVV